MQTIQNIKTGVKNMLITTLELAQVRLEMARIELHQHTQQLVAVLISALLLIVFLFIALMSGLFAVNAYFDDPSQRLIAFMSISGIALLLVLLCMFMILNALKKQRGFMQRTMEEVKLDIVALKQLANRTE
ncbi:phage holin family protein [Lonepinella sp. BR2357]|uniref:phage holin family protein n=1 Tax=Lonepinella sp. BR2357 TaxID=3434549 RepID=UPI003F6E00DC